MKMNFIKYTALALVVALGSVSCTHLFDNYNDDPNRLPLGEIAPEDMMEDLLFNGINTFVTRGYNLTGELIQFTATGTSNTAIHRYFVNAGTTADVWLKLSNHAVNADHMYELAVDANLRNYQAVALTLRALFVSNLTDIYGDIPFSQAFTMYSDSPNEKPSFDRQEDVYVQLLKDLETANGIYSMTAKFDPGYRDLLFNGDIARWKKFTNSLYLRLLMRLSNRNDDFEVSEGVKVSDKIAQIFNNPLVYPVFESYEEGAIIEYSGQTPFVHPYGTTTTNSWNSRRGAEYFINLLEETRDPRLSRYFTMAGADWEGNPSGMPMQDMSGISAATLNKNTLGLETSPYCILKHDEVIFVKLEAMYRGWISGDQVEAEELWREAVGSNIRYWNWSATTKFDDVDAVVDLYISRNPYVHTLEFIMSQKYICLFWNGFEAWHEWRRTEYPVLPIGTATHNDRILPRRLEYPINTRETNRDNYDVVISRYAAKYRGGGDNMKTPVWWSKASIENER